MRYFFLIILAFQSLGINSQSAIDCDLNKRLRIHSSDSLVINKINNQDFGLYDNKLELTFQDISNSDSIENLLINNYDFIDQHKDSLIVNCRNKQISLILIKGSDYKENKSYKIKFIYKDQYVVIYESGYESWTYYLIDLKSKYLYTSPGIPRVIMDKYIYGCSNYYGDFDFVIYNLKNNSQISFTLDNAIVKDEYIDNEKLKFKVVNPCNDNDSNRTDYFEIKIINGL